MVRRVADDAQMAREISQAEMMEHKVPSADEDALLTAPTRVIIYHVKLSLFAMTTPDRHSIARPPPRSPCTDLELLRLQFGTLLPNFNRIQSVPLIVNIHERHITKLK